MSRVQLALNVADLDASIEFYTKLFQTAPAKVRDGYANFAIVDPPLKLVLFTGMGEPGSLNHIGVEVESTDEVAAVIARTQALGMEQEIQERRRAASPCRTRPGSRARTTTGSSTPSSAMRRRCPAVSTPATPAGRRSPAARRVPARVHLLRLTVRQPGHDAERRHQRLDTSRGCRHGSVGHRVDVLAGGVSRCPVLVALAGEEGAGVAAAHRDDDVGRPHDLVGPRLRGTPR